MRLFKLKTSQLAQVWQNSFKIYWPAFGLMRILGPMGNAGPLMGMVLMLAAAWLEWWVIYAAGIRLARLYFRKPPISNVSKVVIIAGVLVVAVIFYKASPAAFGDPRSPLEKAMAQNDVAGFEKILKADPSLANKRIWANNTPLGAAINYPHPKEFIDLLVKYGADINAKVWSFENTPLQAAAWGGKTEAVKALLAHHPDVNAMNDDSKNGVGDDSTALDFAFVADNKEIFSLLLAAGADINHGRSVLAECMGSGDRDSWAEFLLTNGANPNYLGPKGDRFVPIIQAVLSGNTNYVAALLRHNVDLSARYINGGDNFSPLELALDEQHWDVARLIASAMIQTRTNTVSLAAANGNLESLRAMLATNPAAVKKYDETRFTPLHWAAEAGQKDVAELLLSDGADPLAKDWAGFHPLHWAAFMGRSNIVETLIAHKADVNVKGVKGITPLHLAVQQGFVSIAEMLLKAGADPNGATSWGNTPLCTAVGNGNIEAARLLLAYHANFGVQIYGGTLFHDWAMGTANVEIANLLLTNGCGVNATNSEGKTPLHVLVEAARFGQVHEGDLQAVQWLLDHKADVNAKDVKGETPLSLLQWRNRGRTIERRKDLADLLRQHGAKE